MKNPTPTSYILTIIGILTTLFLSPVAQAFPQGSQQVQSPKLFKLNSSDPTERKLAVYYLSESGNPQLVKKFCEMLLNDKSTDVRATVAERLGDYYYTNKEAENCLLKALKKEKNKAVIKNIVYAISNFDDVKAGKVLCRFLNSKDPDIRRTAIVGLIKFQGLCDKQLFELLKKDKNADEKVLLARILGMHKYKPAKPYMKKLLKSPKPEDVLAALNFFKYYPDKTVNKTVEKILRNTEDQKIEEAAFDVLVASNDPAFYSTIETYLLQPQFQKRFALRLPSFKGNIPPKVLKLLLQSDDTTSRIAALTYIGEHKLKGYCDYVKQNVYNKSADVQAAAIWALGKAGCQDAVKILCDIISNYNLDDDVRANAAQALSFLPKKTLKKNLNLIKEVYKNEFLDDIKDTIMKAIKKATSS
ncbi:HEAT repeat-containing protein [Desulfurobacterium pacificum]|uniref:HEAT repeat-containing protein n=1 Tax=Desulfurobacterium pacificum TaxID=240166 RepID=A0ABY1NVT7_9BACT|nr:HEAT repeat domain-containing protein [Desulfurobacterium pacificum]SMP19601.1 HEAT repeat-containing protein [Desulfurobacterium pacificum]